ncbi:MAG: hypothetical protein KDK30_04090 [Leptospiraceae bacterium]|nr:hypothetical protein [Leptospiraceae bacterium]MCB1318159.1 hypothetical protein [Leptospiraceae bacterium]
MRREIDRLQNELIAMNEPQPRKKLNKERERRPKRVSHTHHPAHRREDDTSKAANTFMDRMRLFRLKNDLQMLWDRRDEVSRAGK